MSGLHLHIPQAFEVRVVEVGKDTFGGQVVVLEVRQMVGGDDAWKRAKPLRVKRGDRLALTLDHYSEPYLDQEIEP